MIKALLGRRFYIFILVELKSRRIVKWSLTGYPCRKFVRQQVIDFSYDNHSPKTLISGNVPQFISIDYSDYGITGVNISLASPNMNAFVERLNGTIRREALDHFLLLSEKQVRKIVKEYVDYYNHQRPHQGINGIPDAEIKSTIGIIKKNPILGGLHHNYYRISA